MNHEQTEYIQHQVEESTKLLACAGSGKTRCILHRICYLITNMAVTSSHIQIFTFSKLVQSEITNKLKLQKEYSRITQKRVNTIDAFSYQVLEKQGKTNEDVSTLTARVLQLLLSNDSKTTQLIQKMKTSHIFIDEAQDLNQLQYDFIVKLSQLWGAHVHMVGDPNQAIYQFRHSNAKFLLNFTGRAFYLNTNHRCPPQIDQFAYFFKRYQFNQVLPEFENKEKKQIKLYLSSSYQDHDQFIVTQVQLLRERGLLLKNIAILSPCNGNSYETGIKRITNLLHTSNIPYRDHSEHKDKTNDNAVNVMTIHCSKGLEFSAVFLTQFSDNLMGQQRTDERENLNLLYVACTRASKFLFILSNQNFCSILAQIPRYLYSCDQDQMLEAQLLILAQKQKKQTDFGQKCKLQDTDTTVNLLKYKSDAQAYALSRQSKRSYSVLKQMSVSQFIRSLTSLQKLEFADLFNAQCELMHENVYKSDNALAGIRYQNEALLGVILEHATQYFVSNRAAMGSPIQSISFTFRGLYIIIRSEQAFARVVSVQDSLPKLKKLVLQLNNQMPLWPSASAVSGNAQSTAQEEYNNSIDFGRISLQQLMVLQQNMSDIWQSITQYNDATVPWQNKLKALVYVFQLRYCRDSCSQLYMAPSELVHNADKFESMFHNINDHFAHKLCQMPGLRYQYALDDGSNWRGIADFVSLTAEEGIIIDIKAQNNLALDSIMQLALYDMLLQAQTGQERPNRLIIMNCLDGNITEIFIKNKQIIDDFLIKHLYNANEEKLINVADCLSGIEI